MLRRRRPEAVAVQASLATPPLPKPQFYQESRSPAGKGPYCQNKATTGQPPYQCRSNANVVSNPTDVLPPVLQWIDWPSVAIPPVLSTLLLVSAAIFLPPDFGRVWGS